MKSTLALLALSFTLSSGVFAAESVSLTIKTEETTTFKKISKTMFEKIISSAKGTVSLDYNSAKGIKNLLSQDVNETDDKNSVVLEVKGKNIVRLVDTKEDVDTEIQADVDRTIFGNIKSVNISSDNIYSVYEKSIKRSGVDVLKKLRIVGENGAGLTSDIQMSDLNCLSDGDILNCKQNVTLKIEVKK